MKPYIAFSDCLSLAEDIVDVIREVKDGHRPDASIAFDFANKIDKTLNDSLIVLESNCDCC